MPPQSLLADLLIRLGLDATQFQAGLAAAATSVRGFSSGLAGVQTAAAGALKSPAGATAFAYIGDLTVRLGGLGQRYAEIEALEVRLRQAVENTGTSFATQAGAIKAVTDAGERYGFQTTEILQSFSLLVAQTGSVSEAVRRQNAAYDLARAGGADLTTSSRLLGKVTEDNLKTIGRLGFIFHGVGTEEELFSQIQERVAGQAAAQANTIAASTARIQNTITNALVGVGGFLATNASSALLFAIALETLGVSASTAAAGLTKVSAAALGIVVPFGLAVAAVGGLLLVAKKIGEIGGGTGPLAAFSDSVDLVGKIVDRVGWAGLIGGLLGSSSAARTSTASMDVLAAAFDTVNGALEKVQDRILTANQTPAAGIFAQAKTAADAFGLSADAALEPLGKLRDALFGTEGLTAVDALRAMGTATIDNIAKAARAELDSLESQRQSAKDEAESVAHFWAEEADRRIDFMETLAKKSKPAIETIDQLNKDLGPGFDQRRRAAQAAATRQRLEEEIADMQDKENRRIALLRPPSTPTLDKLAGATVEEKLAGLDAKIASAKTRYDKVVLDLNEILEKAIDMLAERLGQAESILKSRRMLEGEPGPFALSIAGSPSEGAIRDDLVRGRSNLANATTALVTALGQAARAQGQTIVTVKVDPGAGPLDTFGQYLLSIFQSAQVEVRKTGSSISAAGLR